MPFVDKTLHCLDCGKEFPYNWREMRIEKPPVLPSNASRVIVLE